MSWSRIAACPTWPSSSRTRRWARPKACRTTRRGGAKNTTRRWDEERALLAHLAELAEEREREVRALSRRYLLFSADAIAVGPTPDGVGLESFLSQQRQTSGKHTTFGFRFGIEGEPIAYWVQMRAGTYLEPSRFAGVGYRVHGTLGADVRLFSWDFFGLIDEFTLRAGAAADVAERYLNAGVGIGLGIETGSTSRAIAHSIDTGRSGRRAFADLRRHNRAQPFGTQGARAHLSPPRARRLSSTSPSSRAALARGLARDAAPGRRARAPLGPGRLRDRRRLGQADAARHRPPPRRRRALPRPAPGPHAPAQRAADRATIWSTSTRLRLDLVAAICMLARGQRRRPCTTRTACRSRPARDRPSRSARYGPIPYGKLDLQPGGAARRARGRVRARQPHAHARRPRTAARSSCTCATARDAQHARRLAATSSRSSRAPPASRSPTRVLQLRDQPDPKFVLGRGKLEDMVLRAHAARRVDVLIFDRELSPAQARGDRQDHRSQGDRSHAADPRHLRAARAEPWTASCRSSWRRRATCCRGWARRTTRCRA